MPTLPDHDPAAAWHALSAKQALQLSGVDPDVGLRSADGLFTGLTDRHGMVCSGTHVTAGRARALVVAA